MIGDQVLQAVKFTDKKVPGLHLDLDDDLQAAGCFMDVIIPSPRGLTPEKWKQTATLCPLDWPSPPSPPSPKFVFTFATLRFDP